MINSSIEIYIIKNLFANQKYANVVIPYLEQEYVHEQPTKLIFSKVKNYINKRKTIPSINEIMFEVSSDSDIPDSVKQETLSKIEFAHKTDLSVKSDDWLIDETEKHFQQVLFYTAVLEAADAISDEEKKRDRNKLPEKMKKALAFTFDTHIGREYGTDKTIAQQFNYYKNPDNRYTFPDWPYFNQYVTAGGTSKKKLHIVVAGTGGGKTLWLSDIALQYQKSGLHVLYLTGEDGEERINERLDGNILDTDTDKLYLLNELDYTSRIKNVVNKTKGRLIIKEFAAKKLSVLGIEALLNDLKIKEDFTPDALIVDYVTLLKSDLHAHINNTNSYYTSVAEELRGLATERNMIAWSGCQLNRNGMTSTDPELTDLADAIGIAFTADFSFVVLETDELKKEGKQVCKQLKSRYCPIKPSNERWLVNVKKERQQIFEIANPKDGLGTIEQMPEIKAMEDKINTVVDDIAVEDKEFIF